MSEDFTGLIEEAQALERRRWQEELRLLVAVLQEAIEDHGYDCAENSGADCAMAGRWVAALSRAESLLKAAGMGLACKREAAYLSGRCAPGGAALVDCHCERCAAGVDRERG